MVSTFSIAEIFYTIQGEGRYTGYPAIFIRLAGCNLNCPWCDTDFKTRFKMTGEQLLSHLATMLNDTSDPDNVIFVITGGEPTLQDYVAMVTMLKQRFRSNTVTLETNGRECTSTWMSDLRWKGLLWVTVSPKIGVEDCTKYFDDPSWCGDELKVVLDPEGDLSVLPDIPYRLKQRFKLFYIQPCSEDNDAAINFVKENPAWKLSLQTQKMVGIE